jgi:hypothetical protein
MSCVVGDEDGANVVRVADELRGALAGPGIPHPDDALGRARGNGMSERVRRDGIHRRLRPRRVWRKECNKRRRFPRSRGRDVSSQIPELDGSIERAGGHPILFATV